MTEYFCLECREKRTTYCGTDSAIGDNPVETWPKDLNIPCTLQKEKN